jgi:hypothetical protein
MSKTNTAPKFRPAKMFTISADEPRLSEIISVNVELRRDRHF